MNEWTNILMDKYLRRSELDVQEVLFNFQNQQNVVSWSALVRVTNPCTKITRLPGHTVFAQERERVISKLTKSYQLKFVQQMHQFQKFLRAPFKA